MSDNDDAFLGPDDSQEETVGEALADYLGLVEETIRIQVTDDDIRDRVRRAMDLAASVQDTSPDHVRGHDFSDRQFAPGRTRGADGRSTAGPRGARRSWRHRQDDGGHGPG